MLFQNTYFCAHMKALASLFIFIISVFIADAQNIGGGLALGLNASQVDGDNYAGYHKMGLNIGVTGFIPVRDKMAISVEISLNQKGSTKRPHPQDPYGNSYKLRLDYLDIPILFNFKDKNKLIVAGGFSYGTLVRFEEIVNGTYNTYPINDPPYSPFDINAIADLKYPIREKLFFNFRYSYSMLGIRTYMDYMGRIRGQRNHYMAFRLLYLLNY